MDPTDARSLEEAVRVLVVDDHAGFLRAVAPVIEATAGFKLAGTAATGSEALQFLDRDRFVDLVLLDVHMEPIDGIEVARRYVGGGGTAAIVLMSTAALDELSDAARDPSVAGFLPKESLSTDALARIWEALQQPS